MNSTTPNQVWLTDLSDYALARALRLSSPTAERTGVEQVIATEAHALASRALAPIFDDGLAFREKLLDLLSARGIEPEEAEPVLESLFHDALQENPLAAGLTPERAETVRIYDSALAFLTQPVFDDGVFADHHYAVEEVLGLMERLGEDLTTEDDSDFAAYILIRHLADQDHQTDSVALDAAAAELAKTIWPSQEGAEIIAAQLVSEVWSGLNSHKPDPSPAGP